MTILHKDIADADRHEPKGISTAAANTAYITDGLGTGTWRKVASTDIKGLSGDAGVAGRLILTDGTNGFTLVPRTQIGEMYFANNGNAFALTAAADTTLATGSQYVLYTGTGAPWTSQNLEGITFDTDKLTVSTAGVYMMSLWATITGFPSNTAKVAFRYRVNGTTVSAQKAMNKSNSSGDVKQIFATGLISLAANDYVQLVVASDATGNLIVSDIALTMHMVK